MNVRLRASVRNLNYKEYFAQTDRVHTQRLCRGAVRGAGGVGRQLLCPLHELYPGASAGPFDPSGRGRARLLRRHRPLLFARARESSAARPGDAARGAAGPVRGGGHGRTAGQLHAGHRRVEIPVCRRFGGFEFDQPASEPADAQPGTARQHPDGDGRAVARRGDGRLCRRLHRPLLGSALGVEHLVPGKRQTCRFPTIRGRSAGTGSTRMWSCSTNSRNMPIPSRETRL